MEKFFLLQLCIFAEHVYPALAQQINTYHVLDLQASATEDLTVLICPVLNTVSAGTNYTCTIDHGEEEDTGQIYTTVLPVSCISYVYSSVGNKTLWSHCVHPANNTHVRSFTTVYVGVKISGTTLLGSNGQIFLPVKHSNPASLTVTWINGSDVNIQIYSENDGSLLYEAENVTSPVELSFNFAQLGGVYGQTALRAFLFNPISNESAYAVVDYQEEILNFDVSTNLARYLPVGFEATYNITLGQGSDVVFALEFTSYAYVAKILGIVRTVSLNNTFDAPLTDEVFRVVASNNINKAESKFTVTVQYLINNITVTWDPIIYTTETLAIVFNMAADALVPMGTVDVIVDYGDGIVDICNLSTLLAPGNQYTLNHVFAVGSYQVTVNMTSELNTVLYNWTQYVENEVRGLELVHEIQVQTSEAMQNISVRMTDSTVSPLLNMTCVFDIDGTIYESTFNLYYGQNATVVHTFQGDGNKTILFNCSNMQSWQTGIGYIELYKTTPDCFATAELFVSTNKNPLTPIQMHLTNVNRITGNVVVTEMCRNSSREYKWKLWKIEGADENVQTYYENEANQPNSITIQFGKEALSPGLYKVQLLANLTQIEDGYALDYVYVNFNLPPFIAGILGGTTVQISSKAVIEINAIDASNDPVVSLSTVPFLYAWECRQTTSTDQQIQQLLTQHAAADPTFDFSSLGSPCSYPSLTSAGKFVFDASNVAANQWYMFKVTLTKSSDVRMAEAIQGVKVLSTSPPAVSIRCTRNCLPKLAIDTKFSLFVQCGVCKPSETSYQWKIKVFDPSTNAYNEINYYNDILDTGLTSATIAIKADVLTAGNILLIEAQVTVLGNPDVTTVSYITTVNYPPYGGSCKIEPSEGFAALTIFTIDCPGWKDEGPNISRDPANDNAFPLYYTVYQLANDTSTGSKIISSGARSSQSRLLTVLHAGEESYGHNTEVMIVISDEYFGSTSVTLNVQVKNPLQVNLTWPADDAITAIIDLVNSTMMEARLLNDPSFLIQQAAAVSSILNAIAPRNVTVHLTSEQPSDWSIGLIDVNEYGNDSLPYQQILDDLLEQQSDTILNTVQKALVNMTSDVLHALSSSNTTTYDIVEGAAWALSSMMSNKAAISVSSGALAAEALNLLTQSFQNITKEKLREFFGRSDPNLESTATSIFEYISTLVSVTVPDDLPLTFVARTISSTADAREYVEFLAYVHQHDSYVLIEQADMTEAERTGLFRLRARIAQLQFLEQKNIATYTMREATSSAASIEATLLQTVCTGCVDMYKAEILSVTLASNYFLELNGEIIENSNINITLDMLADDYDVVNIAFINYNKNPYIFGSTNDGSAVTSDVQTIAVTDTNGNKVSLALVSITQSVLDTISGFFIPEFTPEDPSKCFYHVFMYRKTGDYVCVYVRQVEPLHVASYNLYFRFGEYPNALEYDAESSVVLERDWATCISPQYFTSTGKMYLGLCPTAIPGSTGFNWNGISISDPLLSPYNITIVTSSCTTWDITKEEWGTNDCQMDWYPYRNEVECRCNEERGLTFGNTFYVPPNTIDFSTVFLKFSPQDHAAVLSLLVLILALYLLLLVWARHQDKKDIVKWGVTPLMDNFVDDTYFYLITVYTGLRPGSGTNSRVGFTISGSEGDTGIRELYDGVRREIKTGSVNHYLMSTSHPVGELDYIYIWHDNSGDGNKGSWYLNRIDVEDLQSKQRFVFLCGRWLSLASDDQTLDAVLPVCGRENVTTFENMFFLNAKENLAESHIWVSIFFRPTSSHFTRVQRVTCLLLFVMMTMIANAIYFQPADEYDNPNVVRAGPFVFSWQSVYVSVVSALISTPSVFIVLFMFRKSKPHKINTDLNDPALKYAIPAVDSIATKMLRESKELEKTLVAKGMINNDGTILPFWFSYIAWFIALGGSFAAGFFLMLFSMEWGKNKSEMWLTQFFLSFFEASAILDPLKVLILAALFAFVFTQIEKFKPSPLKRSLILKNYRQRFHCPTDIRLPANQLSDEDINKAREERKREVVMMNAVKECIISIMFLWIIYSISYSNRDDRSYAIHADITNNIVDLGPKNFGFHKILTMEQYTTWLSDIALPALFPEYEYNGDRLHWRWRQYTKSLTGFRVGPPRLRQLRSITTTDVLPFVGSVVKHPSYSIFDEDKNSYCFNWTRPPCDEEKETYSFSYQGWKYTDPRDVWGVPVVALYNTYNGGGYIMELDVNWDFSNRTLSELVQYLWFDHSTRAVFLEYTVYSANLNIFTYVTLVAEFMETGGVTTFSVIYPMRVYQHHGNTGVYMIFCEIMFLLFLLVLTIRIIINLHKMKMTYFTNVWRSLDLVCAGLGYIGVAMYFGRLYLATNTMDKFQEDPKTFVNFQHVAYWDLLFVSVLSILVFFATIRIVGLLGYDKRIGEVFRVIDNCSRELFWFGLMFIYIFIAYAILGYLLFGRSLEDYLNIFDSLGTLFISMIGKSKFKEMNDRDPVMAQFYFFTYILLVVYVMLTIFLAILCESINTVHNMTKSDRSQELVEYIINEFKRMFGGKNSKEKPNPDIDCDQAAMDVLADLQSNLHAILKDAKQPNKDPFDPKLMQFENDASPFAKLRRKRSSSTKL